MKIPIRELRVKSGLTLAEASQLFGVTAPTFMRWEKGTATPSTLHIAIFHQLEQRMSDMEDEHIRKTLKGMLLFGGVTGFMKWMFTKDTQ